MLASILYMCVALAALEAVVRVQGPTSERTIQFEDFHRLPGSTPEQDTNLGPDELITALELPATGFAQHSAYLKLRDRSSYAFALVSVAVGLEMAGNTIKTARLALGGVAHKPWRDPAAEQVLAGQPAAGKLFAEAAAHITAGAVGYEHKACKIELARRAIVRARRQAAAQAAAPAAY